MFSCWSVSQNPLGPSRILSWCDSAPDLGVGLHVCWPPPPSFYHRDLCTDWPKESTWVQMFKLCPSPALVAPPPPQLHLYLEKNAADDVTSSSTHTNYHWSVKLTLICYKAGCSWWPHLSPGRGSLWHHCWHHQEASGALHSPRLLRLLAPPRSTGGA